MKAIPYSYKLTPVAFWLYSLAFLFSLTMPVEAEVYRWVDSEGKTHYGDRAPQEQRAKAERLNIEAGSQSVDPDAERNRQQLRSIEEGRQRERAFAEQKAAQEQQKRAELAQRCKSLQNEIRDDRNAAVFFRYDEKGNRVLWSNEERLAHREQLNTLKQTYCPELPD